MRTVLAILVFVLFACGGPDCTLVPTPDGYLPKACVIEVPNGATGAEDSGIVVVTAAGNIIATYPPCPCPSTDAGPRVPTP